MHQRDVMHHCIGSTSDLGLSQVDDEDHVVDVVVAVIPVTEVSMAGEYI